jgi:PIN domain nuclease of toxin-antitoxin system
VNYLLDTATFLWLLNDQREKVPEKIQSILNDDHMQFFLSSATTWELAIKSALGKLEIRGALHQWLPELVVKMGFIPLSITQQHSLGVGQLPMIHKDPFDRLLVSQARAEKLTIISPDSILSEYDVSVVW